MEGLSQKLRTTMMSHLSDVQESFGSDQVRNMNRLNFVKWLMLRNNDISLYHYPDKDWKEFENSEYYQK